MKMTRPRKVRLLKKAGLRHVAGWVDEDDKPKVDKMIEEQSERVKKALGGKGKEE